MTFNILAFPHARPKLSTSSISRASHASQVQCVNLITAQVGSFSLYFWLKSALFMFWPLLTLAHCRLIFKFGSLSALARCQPLLDFGPSSALAEVWLIVNLARCWPPFGFWLVVGPFWSLAIVSPGLLSTHFGVLTHCQPFWIYIHQPLATVAGQPASLYLFRQSPLSTVRSQHLPLSSSFFWISNSRF